MRVDAKIDAKTRKDGSIDMNRLAYQAKIQGAQHPGKAFPSKTGFAFFHRLIAGEGSGN